MYYYVEVLRAKRCLLIVGIILGLTILSAIGIRIWSGGYEDPAVLANRLEHSPTAHVTRRTLADGTLETVVDDPANRSHAVIDFKGHSLHMLLTEPGAAYAAQRRIDIDMDGEQRTQDGLVRIRLRHTDGETLDLSALLLGSAVIGLLAASLLAAPLAKENEGHLELAWTKPVSRTAYALACFATDALSIVVSQLLTVAAVLICCLFFFVPQLTLGSAAFVGLAFAAPIAWYAMLTTIGASVKRGPGMIVGLGWLGAIVVISVADGTRGLSGAIGMTVHAVSQAVAYLTPVAYLTFGDNTYKGNGAIVTADAALAIVCILALVYLVTAVLQWRRLEA